MCAVVILAGGKSRRMGFDKLSLPLGGRTLLEAAVSRFGDEFEDVYISVADAGKYPDIEARRIVDILPGAGPLSGLHAALTELHCGGVFLVAADLPFSSPRAAKRIIELCAGKEAAVLELPNGMLEPLFGYYSASLLRLCVDAIESGEYKLAGILRVADTRFVRVEELGALWDEKMILNINRPEDFDKAAIEFSRGQ